MTTRHVLATTLAGGILTGALALASSRDLAGVALSERVSFGRASGRGANVTAIVGVRSASDGGVGGGGAGGEGGGGAREADAEPRARAGEGNVTTGVREETCDWDGEVEEISMRDVERFEDAVEIVVAGFRYETDFRGHYLWRLGVPRARVVLYRRERPEVEARAWRGPCGMYGEERLLLPNHGRDAAAFWDYARWRRDSPPRAVAFVHGHVAQGYHTNCDAILTRLHAYHRGMGGDAAFAPLPNALVTFTEPTNGRYADEWPLYWFGQPVNGVRMANPETEAREGSCQDVLRTVNITLSNVDVTSCCGSFIMPGAWLRGHALSVYDALFRAVANPSADDSLTARQCFEFIVYAMFSPKFLPPGLARAEPLDRAALARWFRAARALRPQLHLPIRACSGHA